MNPQLILGTVAFGMDYGITNQEGKVPKEEVAKILEYAVENGISILDTAQAYGDAERVLGRNLVNAKKFRVISKF